MISGTVTADREAVVPVVVFSQAGRLLSIQAIVDTGFTDELTLPPEVIDRLSLPHVDTVTVFLAGEVTAEFDTHVATIEWEGALRNVLAYSAEGPALVGMSPLEGRRLLIDVVDGGLVSIASL